MPELQIGELELHALASKLLSVDNKQRTRIYIYILHTMVQEVVADLGCFLSLRVKTAAPGRTGGQNHAC